MKNFLSGISRGLALTMLVAMLLPLSAPSLRDAQAEDWKKVTLLYSGDINGKVEPCG